jgi:acetyl-CoA acetyltransferase
MCPQGCAPVCRSDRNDKTNLEPVNPGAVLEAVSRMPISTWSYREEATATRHMGPMAQDFRSAFGLGDSERYYYSVDAHGVALAAIQALNTLVQEQKTRLEVLERQQAELQENCQSRSPGPLPGSP